MNDKLGSIPADDEIRLAASRCDVVGFTASSMAAD
jgi:hypothetical protein